MKKAVLILLISLMCMAVMSGCTGKDAAQGNSNVTAAVEQAGQEQQTPVAAEEESTENDIVDIKEKMFITQINDIYLNPDEYMNKKIRLEGFHDMYELGGKTVHGVIRNGPGCCGNDGVAGFEFVWDGEYPKANDWLRVTGSLEIVKEGDTEYIRLKASEVEVLEERGAEFVVN